MTWKSRTLEHGDDQPLSRQVETWGDDPPRGREKIPYRPKAFLLLIGSCAGCSTIDTVWNVVRNARYTFMTVAPNRSEESKEAVLIESSEQSLSDWDCGSHRFKVRCNNLLNRQMEVRELGFGGLSVTLGYRRTESEWETFSMTTMFWLRITFLGLRQELAWIG